MPTPEESGEQKPKKGRCENCGGPGGRRRRLHGGLYVLCPDCRAKTGASHTLSRRGRHAHGGKPGKLV